MFSPSVVQKNLFFRSCFFFWSFFSDFFGLSWNTLNLRQVSYKCPRFFLNRKYIIVAWDHFIHSSFNHSLSSKVTRSCTASGPLRSAFASLMLRDPAFFSRFCRRWFMLPLTGNSLCGLCWVRDWVVSYYLGNSMSMKFVIKSFILFWVVIDSVLSIGRPFQTSLVRSSWGEPWNRWMLCLLVLHFVWISWSAKRLSSK